MRELTDVGKLDPELSAKYPPDQFCLFDSVFQTIKDMYNVQAAAVSRLSAYGGSYHEDEIIDTETWSPGCPVLGKSIVQTEFWALLRDSRTHDLSAASGFGNEVFELHGSG
jgi:hypothetical protein